MNNDQRLTAAEVRVLDFCVNQMADLSAEEWLQHGFRQDTFERASLKVGKLLGAPVAAQEEAPPREAGAAGNLLRALTTGIPLEEPVRISKALLAQREARVILSGGTGPVSAVHLVNIGLTGWVYTPETAEAYAKGYNTALKQYRSALLSEAGAAAPDEGEAARTDRKRLAILATFAQEVCMGAILPSERAAAAKKALRLTGLQSLDDIVALSAPKREVAAPAIQGGQHG